MNHEDTQDDHTDYTRHEVDLAPLDDFERAWIDPLAGDEPAYEQSGDAFVQAVMQRYEQGEPEKQALVAGRIGFTPGRWAAAAALLLAAAGGWYLYTTTAPTSGTGDGTGTNKIAVDPQGSIEQQDSNDTIPPQPEPAPAVAQADPAKIKIGQLIARTRSTVTQPANNLTDGLRQTPQALRVENLLDLIETPLPDLEELLTPLKPDNQQSRA